MGDDQTGKHKRLGVQDTLNPSDAPAPGAHESRLELRSC